jgi:hypothetical protein
LHFLLTPFIHFTICNFDSFRLCLFTNSCKKESYLGMIRKSSCLLLHYFFLLFEKNTHKKGGGRNDNSIVLFVSLEKEGLWSNDYRNMHTHTHTYTHMHTHTRAPCEFWDMNSLPKEPTKSLFFYSTSIFYFSLKTLVKKSSRLKLLIDECDYKTNQLDSKIIQIAKKIFGSRF